MAPKSNRSFTALIAIVAVAGVGILGYLVAKPAKPLTLDSATLPAIAAKGVTIGDTNAPVHVIEFGDFECPGCGQFAVVTEPDVRAKLVRTGEIYFTFYDYPLVEIHGNALAAHNAAQCANEQGKFWEMHDMIFAMQHEWNTQATRTPKKAFARYASMLGLDTNAWDSCYDSGRMLAQINANRNAGAQAGVNATPTFFINNRKVDNRAAPIPSFDQLRSLILQAKVDAALENNGPERQSIRVP